MNKWLKILPALLAAVYLAACDTAPKRDADGAGVAVEDRAMTGTPMEDERATTSGMQAGGAFRGDPLEDPNSPLSTRVIYFDFDSSEIRPDGRPVVEAHAAYLVENPGASVTLEGHTDERGTREYNLALGERRSQSVERMMKLLGAQSSRIRSVSFGEERPVAEGHVDSAWDQNRRVEIVYRSR